MKKVFFILLLLPAIIWGQTFTGTVTDIRALSGSSYETVFTTDYGNGTWNLVPGDLTSTDNTGTVLVDADGHRYYRQYSGAVNAKWFGLKGDGSTNDRSAFDLMMASGAKQIFIPKGIYRMDSAVVNTGDVFIYGEGNQTVLRRMGGVSGSDFVRVKGANIRIFNLAIEDGGVSSKLIGVNHYVVNGTNTDTSRNIAIEKCTLSCSNNSTSGIFIGQCIGLDISGNSLTNRGTTLAQSLTFGITLYSGGSEVMKDALVKENTVIGFYNGINCYGTASRNNIRISNNVVKLSKRYGIVGYHCSNLRIEANKVDSCNVGIWGDSGSDPETGLRNDQTIISGNFVRNCDSVGIVTEELYNAVIYGNVLSYNKIGLGLGGASSRSVISSNTIKFCQTGIQLANDLTPVGGYIEDITIVGNRIELNYGHGIYIPRNSIARGGISIIGNDIVDNGYQAADSVYAGLYIGTAEASSNNPDYKIDGNTFGRAIGPGKITGSGNQAYGIWVDTSGSTLSNIFIGGGNKFIGNTKAHLFSFGNNVLFRNNYANPSSRFTIDNLVNTDNGMNISAILNFSSVPAHTEGSGLTITLNGALTTNNVIVNSNINTPGITYKASVTSSNTVTVYPVNATSAAIDPPSGSFSIIILK